VLGCCVHLQPGSTRVDALVSREVSDLTEASVSTSLAPAQSGPPGRVDITVDDENYEAGSGNIIVITIRNPFEVPISILELTDPKSTNLRSSRKEALSYSTEKNNISSSSENSGRVKKRLAQFFSGFGTVITATIGFGGIMAEFKTPQRPRTLQVNSSGDAILDLTDVIAEFDNIEIKTSGDTRIVSATPPRERLKPVRVIQPHCEANAFLTIDTKGWLFAKPTRLRLKSELVIV
jgi:hypothetical protein